MGTLTLPNEFVQALVNYLTTKPWHESNPYLVEISKHIEAQKPKAQSKEADVDQHPQV